MKKIKSTKELRIGKLASRKRGWKEKKELTSGSGGFRPTGRNMTRMFPSILFLRSERSKEEQLQISKEDLFKERRTNGSLGKAVKKGQEKGQVFLLMWTSTNFEMASEQRHLQE